jgi:hypothetical protein
VEGAAKFVADSAVRMFDYDVPPIRLGPALRRAGLISFLLTPVADPGERAHIRSMADLRVTCICGAIYEVIKTKGPSRETAKASSSEISHTQKEMRS